MGSRRTAFLGGPARLASGVEPPQWHDLLTRVEVLLATLREQVTEIEAHQTETPPSEQRGLNRQQLLGEIDAARSAVKQARRRVAGFSSPDAPLPEPASTARMRRRAQPSSTGR